MSLVFANCLRIVVLGVFLCVYLLSVWSGFNGPELFHVSMLNPCSYSCPCFRYSLKSSTDSSQTLRTNTQTSRRIIYLWKPEFCWGFMLLSPAYKSSAPGVMVQNSVNFAGIFFSCFLNIFLAFIMVRKGCRTSVLNAL